jgi:putative transposase
LRDLAVLFFHLLATVARLAGPGGARSVVAESVLVKQQLSILNRSRKPHPISASLIASSPAYVRSLCALAGLVRFAILLKPSTLLRLHRALTKRKYRLLLSSKVRTKPSPKGPTQEVVAAVVA